MYTQGFSKPVCAAAPDRLAAIRYAVEFLAWAGGAIMRYRPKNIAALHIALGGLPDKMRIEADRGIGVSVKAVGDLRKLTTWPENLVITTPQERHLKA
jgi:hypothetical protein